MAIGKNKKLGKKKGQKKKTEDAFAKKEWYDVKAPAPFSIRQVGKTIVSRTQGTRIARDGLMNRVVTVSLGDLKPDGEDDAFRKFKLKIDEVTGMQCLTNFHGMDMSTDKLRSLVRKWATLIEAYADVKTTDGFTLRLFCIGFTRRRPNQQRKTSYAQSAQIRNIRRKMIEIMVREASSCELKDLVAKFIPEIIGREIEKETQGIYPLQNVFIRKVKTLRAPKVDITKLVEAHGGAAAIAAASKVVAAETVDEAVEETGDDEE